jgi:hypothetical protein
MQVYELSQIQADLIQFKEKIAGFNACYYSLFNTMFNFGFRIGEMTNESRWNITELPNIIIDTEKNSFNRIIQLSDLDDYARQRVEMGLFPYLNTSNSVANYFFKTYFSIPRIIIDTKSVTTHLFRYYNFKYFSAIGWSDIEVGQFMGEVEIQNTINYINAQLYID